MDLHATVKATGREFPEMADPGDIAEEVFKKIDPRDYADVIRLLLRGYVRIALNSDRRVPEPAVIRQCETAPPARSRKVAEIREAWRHHLTDRIHVDGTWKILRDCNAVDLKAAADERRRLAAENSAVARRYERLADLVGSGTVGDLDEETLKSVLS